MGMGQPCSHCARGCKLSKAQEPSLGGRPHPACPHHPASALQLKAPPRPPGLWPCARQLDPTPQLAGGGAARPLGLPGSRRCRPGGEGGWRGCGRSLGAGGCGQRGHRVGASSPALIGPFPAASASNCCWGLYGGALGAGGWRGIGEEEGALLPERGVELSSS